MRIAPKECIGGRSENTAALIIDIKIVPYILRSP
ncbi:hypothetical protein FHS21_006099 [Phyllobacterium trifolii]|uniref:Uncharacterized protein n=1 Tax=Phyllobacterium trifolii TaxID=300193 RepID=A0A839UIA9_9HYPH|nr:hypothetical protein [Phyllobacterium trifolii]